MITAFLECAQKGAVSLSSALDNFRETGEEGGRRHQAWHGPFPGQKQFLGLHKEDSECLKETHFLIVFLPELFTV